MAAYIQREQMLEVFYHHDMAEEGPCADCGEELEDGQPMVEEPAPEVHRNANYITHAWCAVRNGYKLAWPQLRRPPRASTVTRRN